MSLNNKDTFFESVLAELPSDIVVFDKNHRYVYVNPQAVKSPEIREWIIGKTDLEYCAYRNMDKKIAENRSKIFEKVLAEGKEYEWEERMLDRDGNDRFYLRRMGPIYNQEGKIDFLIGYGFEITDRIGLRLQLEENTTLIEKVLNSSPHLIFIKDNNGRFIMVNQALADLYETTINELLNKNVKEVHNNPVEISNFDSTDQQVLRLNKTVRKEECFTKTDGTVLWYETTKMPFYNKNGEVQILVLSTDITDRKNSEQKRLITEFRLLEAEELTKSGNWELDLGTGKMDWSRGMFRIWEVDINNPVPDVRKIYELFHPDDVDKIKNGMRNVRKSADDIEIEYRIIVPSGLKYLLTVIKPVFNAEDSTNRIFGTVIDITAQKVNEALLRENELRLNEVQELANIGSYEFSLHAPEAQWSPSCYKIWKRNPEFGPLPLEEFFTSIHQEDRPYVTHMFDIIPELKGPYEVTYRIVCPDGEEKTLQAINKPHFNSEGQVIKVVGSVTDVTARKRHEENLKRSEKRMIEAQELAHSGSWEYDLQSGINIWSPGQYKLWDLDPSEPVPTFLEFLETIHADDRVRMSDYMEQTLQTGQETSIEYRVTTFTGKQKVMFSRALLERGFNEKPVRIFGTVIDITERKKSEETLRLSEQRLLEAQELANFGSWQLFTETGEVEWSIGSFRIWERDTDAGMPSYEEIKQSVLEEDRDRVFNTVDKSALDGLGFEVEFRIKTAIETIKIVNAKGKVAKDKAGSVIRLFGSVLDVTERKRFEQELIEANRNAEASVRAKEYFLANVSHELRTPLNGVLGMARLLQKTELSSTQRNYIDILSRTAGNLLVIINDILDIAKIESGTLSLEQIVFDPSVIADTAIQTQLYKAEEKDLFLRHILDANALPPVIGDPYRLNQILLNLLTNAVKFTEQGEVVLTHRIREEKNDTIYIEFSVKDSGIGIPSSSQNKIFESFTQVHGNATGYYEGTGLGLTITRNLVEMQGGKIWVESEQGKGSIFSFYIPYKRANAIPEVKPANDWIDPEQFGSLRVLLAEDNRVNQFITEAMLQDWGFTIDIASNGKEAVELVEKNSYDIILMDIQMPEMNGVEATHAIRAMKDPERSQLPIIALTANTTRNAQKKFIAEGMNDCLVKPFKEETLYRKMLSLLEGKGNFRTTIKRHRFPARKKPQASKENLYDLTILQRDARDNPGFVKKMLTIFIDTIPPVADKMLEHFERGEMDAVSTLAHKIKPTLHGAGITSLRETIRNIENYREKKRTRDQLLNDIRHVKQMIILISAAFQSEIDAINESEKIN